MTAKIGDVGTLRELDVKPGDVVEYIDTGATQTVVGTDHKGRFVGDKCGDYEWMSERNCWRLVSRAQPTLWRDMTPEEKVALLLAAHEGKVIEYTYEGWYEWGNADIDEYPLWLDSVSYRVKHEDVRETVAIYGKSGTVWGVDRMLRDTHRITFDTIDGVPDCNSVKMEAI